MIPGLTDEAIVEATDNLWAKTKTFRDLKAQLDRIEGKLNDMLSLEGNEGSS